MSWYTGEAAYCRGSQLVPIIHLQLFYNGYTRFLTNAIDRNRLGHYLIICFVWSCRAIKIWWNWMWKEQSVSYYQFWVAPHTSQLKTFSETYSHHGFLCNHTIFTANSCTKAHIIYWYLNTYTLYKITHSIVNLLSLVLSFPSQDTAYNF